MGTTLTQNSPGTVTVSGVVEYKFENAKLKAKAKETFTFEQSLNVILRVHRGAVLGYELRIENTKLGATILNVRVQFDGMEVPIAQMLLAGESASGVAILTGTPQLIKVMWELPGCGTCWQIVPPASEDKAPGAPIAVTLENLVPIVACLAPFRAKIKVENREKMPLSGELTIRNGPISLYGLNSLQFNELAPGTVKILEGSFVAFEEGKLPFPPFQVAIKEGPQFEVDASNGVFVVGSSL
jgi:hypothetical protein